MSATCTVSTSQPARAEAKQEGVSCSGRITASSTRKSQHISLIQSFFYGNRNSVFVRTQNRHAAWIFINAFSSVLSSFLRWQVWLQCTVVGLLQFLIRSMQHQLGYVSWCSSVIFIQQNRRLHVSLVMYSILRFIQTSSALSEIRGNNCSISSVYALSNNKFLQ